MGNSTEGVISEKKLLQIDFIPRALSNGFEFYKNKCHYHFNYNTCNGQVTL